MFEVTGAEENKSNEVKFYYDEGNGWEELGTDSSSESGPVWKVEGIASDIGSLDNLELKANFTNTEDDYSATTEVNLDQGGPNSFNLVSPGEFALDESPTVEVEVSDDYSGINNVSFSVEDEEGNEETTEECTGDACEADLSNLDDGEEYTVKITAYDNVGNNNVGNPETRSFTVDTEYDGDSNPSFSIEGEDNGIVEFDDYVEMTIDFEDTDSVSETEVTCVVEGEEIDTGNLDPNEENVERTCDIDHDDGEDYYDESAEVYVKMEDEAGNTAESDSETVIFDASSPTVSDLGSMNDLSTFNSNFDVEFSAFDSASGVEEYEYYFNGDSDESTTNDYEEGEFTVDLEDSGLSSGEHNLHVRVKDEAGRWSGSEIFEFEYYPDREPEVSLTVPEDMSVTAGESKEFDVTVENTGEFLIEAVNLDVRSDLLSENDTVEDMEPGDAVTLDYEVDTSEGQIGEYSVDVSTEGPSSSGSFNLRVKANQDQQSSIESDLSEYEQKLQSLESNVSQLEEAVSKEQSTRIASNISEFRNDVETAREAVDAGEYYKAKSALNNIDSDFTKAKTSYENVEQEYQSSQRMKMILGGFAVLLLGGVGGVFVLNREDVIDVDEYIEQLKETAGDLDTGEGGLDLGGIGEKISDLLDNQPEAEEFEWDGFRD